jgi:uncharacterized OsmC-like protein
MRLVLETENRIRLEMTEEAFEIASEGPAISPYHLLGGSLASCTALTVASWAQGVSINVEPLVISISWELAEARPKRVTRIEMEVRWPGLPHERIATVERVADLCPIHATLKRATDLSRRIVPG